MRTKRSFFGALPGPHRTRTAALVLLLLAASLSGCVTLPDPEASQEFSADTVGTVDGSHTVGQTFVSRRSRLNGIELWFGAPQGADSRVLTLELFQGPPGSTSPIVRRLIVPAGLGRRPLRIPLPPQPGPPGQEYHLQLRGAEPALPVLGRAEDVYPGGGATQDGVPIEADLAFRLFYDYDAGAMLGDLGGLLSGAWLTLPLLALLLLPGWLLLDLGGLANDFDGGERVALAAGLSTALVPVLLLWSTVGGLRWNRPAVVAIAGGLAVIAAWRGIRRRQQARPQRRNGSRSGWLLLVIFLASLWVRLMMVRDLVVPAWVDSVHHSLIAQLIVEQGGLPVTYAPFLELETASYHTGFHGLVATFHWLSGLDVDRAMLILGQVLNALMVPASYLLAKTISRRRAVGLVAALVVGLFSVMPAYYATWGRYTQLAGLVILPAGLVLTWRTLPVGQPEEAGHRRRYGLLAAVILAGLVVTHNRVAVFWACLLLAHLLVQHLPDAGWRALATDGLRLAAIAAGALVVALPWMVPALTTLWLPKLQAWSGADPNVFQDFAWRYLLSGHGKYLLVLALLGLAWAAIQRQRFGLTLIVWVALLFCLASLGVWGLPGGGFVNFVSVEITLFLPLAVLVGYVIVEVLDAWRLALPPSWQVAYQGLLAVVFGVALIYGAWSLLPVLNVETVLFHQADEPAMAWIRENTADEAHFLINPMLWSAYMYAGHDGGYWIAPLAGRRTMPPPVLYGLGSLAEIQAVNDLCAAVLEQGGEPAALLPLLHQAGISHVYVGARGGVLSPAALDEHDAFRQVYARQGVSIYQVGQDGQ